jgi:hypothetical protein
LVSSSWARSAWGLASLLTISEVLSSLWSGGVEELPSSWS